MNENNQNKDVHEDSPNLKRGTSAVKTSGWKRILSKKWVSPAAFLAAAAIIVTLMWAYQGTDMTEQTTATTDPSEATEGVRGTDTEAAEGTTDATDKTIEVTSNNEAMQWPVLDRSAVQIVLPYYDANAPAEERQQAMLVSGTTYTPFMGLALAMADDSAFDVLAALSGTVTLSEKHPLNGNIVEISHPNGLVTVYQSLSDVQVKQGDEVKQGTLIAKAGRSEAEKDLGVHLHFAVREDGQPINPTIFLED